MKDLECFNIKMKVLLTTLNAKYVHSNLALKYLYTVVAGEYNNIEVREFTINNDPKYIYTELVRANYDLVCFSCYIWNIREIKVLAENLKKACPNTIICLGGPEVSFKAHQFLMDNPWADYIICGEGEYSFYRFMEVLASNLQGLDTVPGLVYRSEGKIYVNGQMEPMDFNDIPFPYSVLDCESDRVVYYESSRGCPFRCAYCLSSIDKTVRSLNMDRVKADLGYFLYKNVKQVKFIDRTFNYDKKRAYEILKYIIENDNGITNFHFEICADLLDDDTFVLLKKARKGLFQMEIGIQSTNPRTLLSINRHENVYPILYNVERLIELKNIHIHVDLIAGLPYETYDIFKRSFDKVFKLYADNFQLGFLKVLKGTPMEAMQFEHNIIYQSEAPYEVISTKYISSQELVKIKMIENMLDIFYNRGGFTKTIRALIEKSNTGPFLFFEDLSKFYYDEGFQHRDRKKEDQYRILLKYATNRGRDRQEIIDLLTEDMKETMNPEILGRFLRKGWEL